MTVHPLREPRPQTRRGARRARGWAALGCAVVTAIGLSGCGGAHPNTAAIVNGTTISESDLDAVAHDLGPYLTRGSSLPRVNVLTALILRPMITEQMRASGTMVSPEEAANALYQAAIRTGPPESGAPGPQEWSEPTKELAQAQVGMETLSGADRERVLAALSKATIEVSPKYGSFKIPEGIVAPVENWIDASGPRQTGPVGQAPTPTN